MNSKMYLVKFFKRGGYQQTSRGLTVFISPAKQSMHALRSQFGPSFRSFCNWRIGEEHGTAKSEQKHPVSCEMSSLVDAALGHKFHIKFAPKMKQNTS